MILTSYSIGVITSYLWICLCSIICLQPLDVIFSQDHNQIVALLEYVRYDYQPKIQQFSIKIMSILRYAKYFKYWIAITLLMTCNWCIIIFCVNSSRLGELVQLLLKSNAANSLIEDYAACLELRSEESQIIESSNDDTGILIMQVSLLPAWQLLSWHPPLSLIFVNPYSHQWFTWLQLLIDNISRPAPNITHLLLKFDLDAPIDRTVLQPKFHYRFNLWLCAINLYWL